MHSGDADGKVLLSAALVDGLDVRPVRVLALVAHEHVDVLRVADVDELLVHYLLAVDRAETAMKKNLIKIEK